MSFSDDFMWGAASASYQIEGAWDRDGKGLSIWDMFTSRPGAIYKGHTGRIACDHYQRYAEDVLLMKEIGLKAYRFSLSWPRIIPEGTGTVNSAGLDFYDRLVDELLKSGITPFVTLFHWDYPLELYCRGGWLNDDSSSWFADYAAAAVDRLSDRVSHWFTLNEPQVYTWAGHKEGRQAPGLHLDTELLVRTGHNLLLGHGKAVQKIRERAKTPPAVGFAPEGIISIPAAENAEDIEAAREANFSMHDEYLRINSWWMDPVYLGSYPEDGLKVLGSRGPRTAEKDMETINQPLDFFAFNNYFAKTVRRADDGSVETVTAPPGAPLTAYNWDITPSSLYWGSKFFYERYGKPIIISENGMSNKEWISEDGKVHDPQRIDFLRRYLKQLRRAADEGIPVIGYFQWSIMDNFEWGAGYRERFGLIYVDYASQKRILKDSARWYAECIRTNGESL